MTNQFVVGGPSRYRHQKMGLRRAIETRGKVALLFDPGLGKQQPVSEPVLTPDGWRPFGDLRVGDSVFTMHGTISTVERVIPQTERQVYRVTLNDGSWTFAGPDHLWLARTHNDANRGKNYRVVTTKDLMHTASRWEIPQTAPVEYEAKNLPCDPYLMGLFLGDGSLDERGYGSVCSDYDSLVRAGLKPTRPHPGSTYTWYASVSHTALGLPKQSCRSWEKEIPEAFMRGSVEQRRALLAGLLDSDGSPIEDGGVEFSSVSHVLSEQVAELAESLGGSARRGKPRHGGYTVQGEKAVSKRSSYRVNIKLGDCPFRLERKAEAWVEPSKYPVKRCVKSVEYSHEEDSVCIVVSDQSHTYLTRHHIVTHNSATVIDYASLLALKLGKPELRVLVVCPLVAVDTWVDQTQKFVSPLVNYWVEALGGSLLQRAAALAARGGNPYNKPPGGKPPARERVAPRAIHTSKAVAWAAHNQDRRVEVTPGEGPAGLGLTRPNIIIEVINIDTLASRSQVGSQTMADVMVEAIKRYNPDLLVCDESHRLKSPGGNSSKLTARLAKFIPRRVLLTGTIMPSGPLDVFAQWRTLDPYAFGDKRTDGSIKLATFGSFKARYAQLGGWMGKEVIGFKNLDHMQEIMAINSAVARKEDALDLPPTTDVDIPVELSAKEKKAYADMRSDLQVRFESGQYATSSSRLTMALRLRQITAGHLPDDSKVVQIIGHSKADTAASLVNDTLLGEKRVVVFAFFTAELNMLAKALVYPGTEVMQVSGGTPDHERLRLRKRFGSDDPTRMIMVAQISTMSLAVNELVTANHCVFASLSQRRDDYIQARDRLNRIGQTRPVTFWHLIAPGTVDEVILKSHQEKTDLESAVLRHIQMG